MSSQSIFFILPLELRESIYSTAIMSHLLDRDEMYEEYVWQSSCRQLPLLCREEEDIETNCIAGLVLSASTLVRLKTNRRRSREGAVLTLYARLALP